MSRTPLEAQAAQSIDEHPEFRAALPDEAAALAASYRVEDGRENAFLHPSMHLSTLAQTRIDQPTGIGRAVALLAMRRQSLHQAHHKVMERPGEMIWSSQRTGLPPDGQAYIDCVRRSATT